MKRSLWEINKDIESCVDLETGEVLDSDKLESLALEKDEKIESIALWVKNLRAEKAAIDAEKQAFTDRSDKIKRTIESLTNYLSNALQGDTLKTAKTEIKFRKSEVVETTDELLQEFMRVKFEPDKQRIKEVLKTGVGIQGASLVERLNIQIK